MRQHMVPAGPIQDLLRERLADLAGRDDVFYSKGYTLLAEIIWPEGKPKTGTRAIRRIFDQAHVTFGVADLILTRLGEVHMWHSDPVLAPHYMAARITPLSPGERDAYYESQRASRAEYKRRWRAARRAAAA